MFADIAEFAQEIRRFFDELERDLGTRTTGEYEPAIDICDGPEAIVVTADLPGVAAAAVRVILRGPMLLVLGEKQAPSCEARARFHVAERSFGRFARAVRLEGAFDGRRATARLAGGELRITVPRIADRRGTPIAIPVTTAEGER
ncbi:MAG TPA: Hsp20/alpha crystallin family protein [Vicinamibacterales bacterium]|nr:Hsp20/alpha crystallin family protein [Vicinamibacterales bacterium]